MTIIDGGSARALFIVNDTSGDLITISGFTFQNGSAANFGGAIYVINGRVDIRDFIFYDNYAGSYGGAIEVESGFDVQIIGNFFEDNLVQYGGGSIYVGSKDPDNTVILIEENIFNGGEADYGSAISNWNSAMMVNRNTFVDTLGPSAIRLASPGPVSTISNNFIIRSGISAIEFI